MTRFLDCGGRSLPIERPLVMGILNVTPDSFSDGGLYDTPDVALAHAEQMLAEGADILDVGGESTRPGAIAVSEAEEIGRVIPIVRLLSRRFPDTPLSVDTSKPGVMRAAAAEGAWIINDVRALQMPGALDAACETGLAVCLMHMQGEPRTMQSNPHYDDVVADIIAFLAGRVGACRAAGIPRERLLVDPGFGFGKTLTHNYTLLRELGAFRQLDLPLMVGVSRKSMIGRVLDAPVAARVNGSVVLAALALKRGASVLRVHDVRETVEAVKLVQAMQTLGVE